MSLYANCEHKFRVFTQMLTTLNALQLSVFVSADIMSWKIKKIMPVSLIGISLVPPFPPLSLGVLLCYV